MDLNELYFDHQISLMRADAADCGRLRLLHRNNALAIARRIVGIHRASGAGAVISWAATSVGDYQQPGHRPIRLATAQ
ncbi:MAG: hypothetical protein J7494_03975 [Sphingobium sp.]|nr:hypothetical protein [Sphingobium sp.]